jgi:hypothetical protein
MGDRIRRGEGLGAKGFALRAKVMFIAKFKHGNDATKRAIVKFFLTYETAMRDREGVSCVDVFTAD